MQFLNFCELFWELYSVEREEIHYKVENGVFFFKTVLVDVESGLFADNGDNEEEEVG